MIKSYIKSYIYFILFYVICYILFSGDGPQGLAILLAFVGTVAIIFAHYELLMKGNAFVIFIAIMIIINAMAYKYIYLFIGLLTFIVLNFINHILHKKCSEKKRVSLIVMILYMALLLSILGTLMTLHLKDIKSTNIIL